MERCNCKLVYPIRFETFFVNRLKLPLVKGLKNFAANNSLRPCCKVTCEAVLEFALQFGFILDPKLAEQFAPQFGLLFVYRQRVCVI